MKILATVFFLALAAGCYSQYFEENLLPYRISDKFVYCDTNSVQKISPEFDYAEPFYMGYAIVANGGRYGLIDRTGRYIVPLKYNNVDYYWSSDVESKDNPDGLCFSVSGDSAFYNPQGRLLKSKPAKNIYSAPYFEEVFEIFASGLKYGYISGSDTLIKPSYDFLSKPAAWDEILVAGEGNKYGIITTGGRILIPFDYSSIRWDEENGVFEMVKEGSEGKCYYYFEGYSTVNVRCGYVRLIRNFHDLYLLVEGTDGTTFYVNLSDGREYRD